jgi:hypothetical protein
MAFLFGRNRQRSASDLARVTKEQLLKLINENGGQSPKVSNNTHEVLECKS